MKIFDLRMDDGSRQFLVMPEIVAWAALRDHLEALPGAEITGYLTDEVTEVWIDFRYRGHALSVNNQGGDYWFFVRDPGCPAGVLESVAQHCASLLQDPDSPGAQ